MIFKIIKRSFAGNNLPPHVKLEMPNLSPTMEKGNIAKWLKKEGDHIKPGDLLASIETDKATVDFEMQEEGYVAKLLYPEGAKDVKLGQVVAILVENKDDVSQFKDYAPQGEAAPQKSQEVKEQPKKEEKEDKRSCPFTMERPSSTPDSAASGGKPQPKQSSPQEPTKPKVAAPQIIQKDSSQYEDIQLSQIKKVTAERLLYSKQNNPHFYVTLQLTVDKLLNLRTKLNKSSSSKISVNDMVIKAASLAAVDVPETNSAWMGDHIKRFNSVNMCFAVLYIKSKNLYIQTDFGLMAPAIKNTHIKGLEEIAKEIKEVAARAKENKLRPDDLSGGTFTVSNLGMYGTHNFSSIINPPQACILSVSAAEKTVVPNDENDTNNKFKIANLMNVTLSSDHRVVDGAVAALWGQAFRKYIENPEFMIM